MAVTQTQVRVVLPQSTEAQGPALTQIYTREMALVSQGGTGNLLTVPSEGPYIAVALADDGQPIGQPTPFNVSATQDEPLEVWLDETVAGLNPDAADIRAAGSDKETLSSSPLQRPTGGDMGTLSSSPWQRPTGGDMGTLSSWPLQRPTGGDGGQAIIVPLQGKASPTVRISLLRPTIRLLPHLIHIAGRQRSLPSYGVVECLVFPGPQQTSRYAVLPFDGLHGELVPPTVSWSKASTQGFLLPEFVFEFESLNGLQNALRHRRPALAQAYMRDALADRDVPLAPSPLATVLAGLVSLDGAAGEARRMLPLAQKLHETQPWLPDALAFLVEVLAKLGHHEQAIAHLRKIGQCGVPWSRLGLRTLTERLDFYATLDSPRNHKTARRWLPIFRRLLALTHPACVFCVFEGDPAYRRGIG